MDAGNPETAKSTQQILSQLLTSPCEYMVTWLGLEHPIRRPRLERVYMNALQRLAETFAELAENGNDTELENALELCIGFADRITHNVDNDNSLTKLREPGGTERNPVRRFN